MTAPVLHPPVPASRLTAPLLGTARRIAAPPRAPAPLRGSAALRSGPQQAFSTKTPMCNPPKAQAPKAPTAERLLEYQDWLKKQYKDAVAQGAQQEKAQAITARVGLAEAVCDLKRNAHHAETLPPAVDGNVILGAVCCEVDAVHEGVLHAELKALAQFQNLGLRHDPGALTWEFMVIAPPPTLPPWPPLWSSTCYLAPPPTPT
jgi:hypothetical protein